MLFGIRDRNVWAIYAAILLLGIAYGISIALIALHLDALGFSKHAIGMLAAWFAIGIVGFSLPAGALMKRFPAKWILLVATLGYAGSVTLFPFLRSYSAIAVARTIDGLFSVTTWICCETILLRRARNDNKALVMSLYAIAIALGYIIGPIAARGIVAWANPFVAFLVAGIVALGASLTVLVLLTTDDRPGAPEDFRGPLPVSTPATFLLWKIKTSCFATFSYGYFQSSVVLFLPLYLIESKGVAAEKTIIIPAFFAIGMVLFSNIAGRLGDKYGHLLVMRSLAFAGALMVLSFVGLHSFYLMCGAVFIAGATLASISPVSLALQGVITVRENYGRANSIYNAFYAAGMLSGPPISSAIFSRISGGAMLIHLAVLWLSFTAFALVFASDDPVAR